MKKGVGLIQAIMMILIISGMMMIVLKYASISAKHTRNSFVREQSELFLNSAIEQTLLEISYHDRSGGCLDHYYPTSVKKRDITYSANIDIKKYYLQDGSDDFNDCNGNSGDADIVAIKESSSESHGMVLLEVEVNATEKSVVIGRILRRTLQQP